MPLKEIYGKVKLCCNSSFIIQDRIFQEEIVEDIESGKWSKWRFEWFECMYVIGKQVLHKKDHQSSKVQCFINIENSLLTFLRVHDANMCVKECQIVLWFIEKSVDWIVNWK